MSGRHVHAAAGGRTRLWLAALAVGLVAALIAAFAGPANASSKTVNAQLSLSGLASADNPLGGSVIGVRPGDKVSFSAAGAPTAGLDKAGLGGLVSGLSNLLAKYRVSADFSGLPGGAKNTILSGSTKRTFTFSAKRTYTFTWSFQSANILGQYSPLPPLDFSGNQLKKLGITLNASNQYVGKIVAATHPPQGGLSIQVPGVKAAPKVGGVALPTISIPGVNTPTIPTSVPNLNPGSGSGGGGGKSGGSGGGGGKATTKAPAPGVTYRPPAVSVPQQVVPGGEGAGDVGGGSGGNGGFRLGVAGNSSNGNLSVGGVGGSSGSTSTSGAGSQNGGTQKTVDLASSSGSPSGSLPVLLAILAVLTLATVAGIYARLYLLGRKTSSS
ncbi:hypothetical protein [uncultured Jatrophihabitans sp.]|uniref:hypothetical protein n=1 Tax=uncultured Jatrophihabitans sp. TaxID=1610747 RepID=UPI0035C9C76E